MTFRNLLEVLDVNVSQRRIDRIREAYRDDLIDNCNCYAGDRIELFGDNELTMSGIQRPNQQT